MIMDPKFSEISGFSGDFNQVFDSNLLTPDLYMNQYIDTMNQFQFTDPPLDLYSITNNNIPFVPSESFPYSILPNSMGWSPEGDSFASSSSLMRQSEPSASVSSSSASWSHDGGSPSDEGSDPVLRFISEMLLEENLGEKPSMFHDPLALQAAESSLFAVLAEDNPSPFMKDTPFLLHQNVVDSPKDTFSGSRSDYGREWDGGIRSTSSSTSNSIDPCWSANPGNNYPVLLQNFSPADRVVKSTSQSFNDAGSLGSSINEFLAQTIFTSNESVLQFRKGLEEASKFLPRENQLVSDLGNNILAPGQKEGGQINKRENSPSRLKGRKNHEREDVDSEEGRSNKQAAVYADETELSEMFDKVLLIPVGKSPPSCRGNKSLQNGATKDLQQNGESNESSIEKTHGKKQGTKKEPVDLRTLLLQCAQDISANDRRTTDGLLKQIRQHSSPLGDGSQRLAHYFADGLEARMDGSAAGIQNLYSSTISKRSAADMLKAYHSHLSLCPFNKIAIFFANKMILSIAEKATTLHIIDFGIMYGFQWPVLIQHLSERSGGPPKLRITGIELPQRGFRPTERIEDTGRRLAKYCERFNVPFEYNGIAEDKWENIQIKDLHIDNSNEVVAVNCLFRFKYLLDETVDANSPRNAVLNLIRNMNPDIFIHAIANGFYNAPFFFSRFREAFFHYSALFNMFDAIASREDQERLMYEREFYGRAIMNVIACEGSGRIERPETYKQWQVRTLRAGFKQVPLDQELMKRFRAKYKAWYHKDFQIDEDSNWMLQGWKGRVLYASSCWVRS